MLQSVSVWRVHRENYYLCDNGSDYRTYRSIYHRRPWACFIVKALLWILVAFVIIAALTRAGLPRGIRNKNPGNIKRNNIQWQGMQQIQNDPVFVQFKSPEYGFRAMVKILRSYRNRGLRSIKQIVSTYAPSNENDTDAYINFVAKQLSVNPDKQLDIEANMQPLIKAMARFEVGPLFNTMYSDADIQNGIALA